MNTKETTTPRGSTASECRAPWWAKQQNVHPGESEETIVLVEGDKGNAVISRHTDRVRAVLDGVSYLKDEIITSIRNITGPQALQLAVIMGIPMLAEGVEI